MRAVIDTYVLVSGLFSPSSPPERVLQYWRRRAFELVVTPALLAEIEGVLPRPRITRCLAWTPRRRSMFIERLWRNSILVEPSLELSVVHADPTDNRVLEAAVEGQADCIVTGDRDLLELGAFEGTRIVTPRDFVAILAREAGQ